MLGKDWLRGIMGKKSERDTMWGITEPAIWNPGFRLGSATHLLCERRQVTCRLWALVSLSIMM